MPTYNYQCDCGVRFEQVVGFDARKDPRPCPACASAARRLMPEGVNGIFVKDVDGPGPQNSGIASLDAHVDRVIGKSAAQGWEAHELRKADKQQALQSNPDADPYSLTQRPDGSWRPLSKKERATQVRAQTINSMAVSSLAGRRRPRSR